MHIFYGKAPLIAHLNSSQFIDSTIGFVPTIRNVLAVVFANGEAFLRLLDDVHTKAWDQRDSKI